MICRERLQKEFAELVAIDNPSFGERRMADVVTGKLLQLGFSVTEDGAGEAYGSDTGNLYGFLKGGLPGEPILLSAHLDTVQPTIGKKAVFHEDGRITGAGDTVLGADNVAGIVEILEGIRHLQEEKIPHRDVEILFPVAEEVYTKGSKAFDFSQVRAREAYVLDLSGAPGIAALKAPSLISFTIEIVGKEAHAGFAPEEGIHAVSMMCAAVSQIPQGHMDKETTVNIGLISGGSATNIVPKYCSCEGEVRSYSHRRALECIEDIRKILHRTFDRPEWSGAEWTLDCRIDLEAYETDIAAPVVARFQKACEKLGMQSSLTATFGGSDNNSFAKNHISGIVLSCGMHEVHSVREYTTLQELCDGAALVAELLL